MPHQAIGMIETRGLVALVEGTDAMLKAANSRYEPGGLSIEWRTVTRVAGRR
jgi:hypothetical protein